MKSRSVRGTCCRALDPAKYNVVLIGLAKDGRWLLWQRRKWSRNSGSADHPGGWRSIALVPGGKGRLLRFAEGEQPAPLPTSMSCSRCCTTRNGEDGTVQGALNSPTWPYVGSPVMGSAAAMDKDVAEAAQRRCSAFTSAFRDVDGLQAPLDYAAVVRAVGSTDVCQWLIWIVRRGISRARSAEEFAQSCALTFGLTARFSQNDASIAPRDRVLGASKTREAMFAPRSLAKSLPADSHGFYSYEAKYTEQENGSVDSRGCSA